jgi:hypothetical protein
MLPSLISRTPLAREFTAVKTSASQPNDYILALIAFLISIS